MGGRWRRQVRARANVPRARQPGTYPRPSEGQDQTAQPTTASNVRHEGHRQRVSRPQVGGKQTAGDRRLPVASSAATSRTNLDGRVDNFHGDPLHAPAGRGHLTRVDLGDTSRTNRYFVQDDLPSQVAQPSLNGGLSPGASGDGEAGEVRFQVPDARTRVSRSRVERRWQNPQRNRLLIGGTPW